MNRKTPLRRTTPLKQGKPLERKAPAKAASKPRKAPRYTGPDALTREIVLIRDGFSCVCCGRSVIGQPYSLQHRLRRSQGGSNSPANLLTVLGTGTTGCHERMDSRRDPADEEKGYTIRSGVGEHGEPVDPAFVPVMVFSPGGSGVLLYPTHDGEWVESLPEDMEAA